MEKKSGRLQPSGKALSTESKKNQDGASGKVWPRGSRRREPNGSSLSAKNEQSRKPAPQRNKATPDKRPRPRGGYQTAAVPRDETTWLDEVQEAELGSVFLPGSKKQSLNHLLNFHYTPYQGQYRGGQHERRSRAGSSYKHKYNKEQFLQANCQFIVNAQGDYKQYMNDPDALVDWHLIEQVNIQVYEPPACPICLYPPVAAKMTRCGHIFCWACVLHYLALSEKPSHKCPICYEAVYSKDLKSVVAVSHKTFIVNNIITFKLMKRAKGSLIAYPADSLEKSEDEIFNMSAKDCDQIYSKLLLADNAEILSIIEREREELTLQLNDDENSQESAFIEQALGLLNERESFVFEKLPCDSDKKSIMPPEVLGFNACVETLGGNTNLENVTQQFEASSYIEPNTVDISGSKSKEPRKYHYFYQATDGQHIYLHPINVKMLEDSHGSLETSPKTIVGKILEKEGGSMMEDIRKKLRYLQHLPLTCEFELVEIQLRQPQVTKETLEKFHVKLESRRKSRQQRLKDERRREKRIAEEENRKMGKYPTPNLHLESHSQFPEFTNEPALGSSVGSNGSIERAPSPESTATASQASLSSSLSSEHEHTGMSFAKMLATAKARPPSWPSLKSPPTPSASVKYVTATGVDMKVTHVRGHKKSDSEPEMEEYESVPQANRCFGDVIAQALQKAAQSDAVHEAGATEAVGQRKKKKNRQVLFATNMAYSEK